MWKRILKLMSMVAIAAVASGCLIKETSHTAYLDPDGTLTWTVLEKDVHSDEMNKEAWLEEEREYLEQVARNEHAVARSLYELYPSFVDSRIVRGERPYIVLTTARFSTIDGLFQRMLDQWEVPGRAVLETRDGWGRFTLTLRVEDLQDLEDEEEEGAEDEEVDPENEEKDCEIGLWDLDRIVLTEGRFIEAIGFEIDGSVAVPEEIDEEEIGQSGGELTLSLTWTTLEE